MFRVLWALVLSAALSFCFLTEANASQRPVANASQNQKAKTRFLKQTEFLTSGVNSKNERVYFLRYFESKAWHVKFLVQDSKGWIETVSAKTYKFETEAEKAHGDLERAFSTAIASLERSVMAHPSKLELGVGTKVRTVVA